MQLCGGRLSEILFPLGKSCVFDDAMFGRCDHCAGGIHAYPNREQHTLCSIEYSGKAGVTNQPTIRALSERLRLPQESDNERWATIVAGFRYWAENPLLGAGIGAQYEQSKREAPKAQGIHSIFVAFLGETGTLGFSALVLASVCLAIQAWKLIQETGDKPWGILLFGAMMLMLVGGIVQDFFYQRVFGSHLALDLLGECAGHQTYLATEFISGV